jgi:hypothetical protein
VKNNWTAGPSGSRWEPQPGPEIPRADHAVSSGAGDVPRRQRRRGVVALLATILTLGTASAGAAYARFQEHPVNPTSATNNPSRVDGQRGYGPVNPTSPSYDAPRVRDPRGYGADRRGGDGDENLGRRGFDDGERGS